MNTHELHETACDSEQCLYFPCTINHNSLLGAVHFVLPADDDQIK
jgi:hypothetical protein